MSTYDVLNACPIICSASKFYNTIVDGTCKAIHKRPKGNKKISKTFMDSSKGFCNKRKKAQQNGKKTLLINQINNKIDKWVMHMIKYQTYNGWSNKEEKPSYKSVNNYIILLGDF